MGLLQWRRFWSPKTWPTNTDLVHGKSTRVSKWMPVFKFACRYVLRIFRRVCYIWHKIDCCVKSRTCANADKWKFIRCFLTRNTERIELVLWIEDHCRPGGQKLLQIKVKSRPPSKTWFLGPTQVSFPKPNLDRFSRFCRDHERDQQTDKRTDHATPSIATGCI